MTPAVPFVWFFAALAVSTLAQLAPPPLRAPQGRPRPRPNRNTPGPWDNDVIAYRVAKSGKVEKVAIFERAGVPTAARLKDGRLVVAHQHFPADNDADFDKVAVRFSSDQGRHWTPPQVIRVTGLPEGMRFPFDPTLAALPDGRVRLYFTSVKGRTFEDDRPAIYSAISSNGLDYAVEPGVRFEIEGRTVIDCAVVLHQGVFHLFAPDNGAHRAITRPKERGAPEPPPPRLGEPRRRPDARSGAERPERPERPREGVGYHATSSDGLHFVRQPDVQLEGRRRWLGNAQSDGAAIQFFGTGEGTPGQRGGVWLASSADGKKWTLDETFPGAPVADPGAVQLEDGAWLIVGTGPPRPGTPSANRRRAGFGTPPGGPPEGRRRPD